MECVAVPLGKYFRHFGGSQCLHLQVQTVQNYSRREQVLCIVYRVEPGYNDITLGDTSSIASDIRWCYLIPYC
jgi:hypothetical protein